MSAYIVEYELDYTHRVQVGVQANSDQEAISLAEKAFDDGTIWDDTPNMPLLFDDYEEVHDNVLIFNVVETLECMDDLPKPDASVIVERKRRAREAACALLIQIFDEAEARGHETVSLEVLSAAYMAAKCTGDSAIPLHVLCALADFEGIKPEYDPEHEHPGWETITELRAFDPETQIAIVWSVEDVLEIRPDLDREQAIQVLRLVKKRHDASIGVNWEVLKSFASVLFGEALPEAE